MPPKTAVPSDCRLAAPAPLANISGSTPKMKAESGHQDRPQPQSSRLHRGLDYGQAFLATAFGEFNDQNGVLRRKPDKHDKADLRINVDLHARGHRSLQARRPSRAARTTEP